MRIRPRISEYLDTAFLERKCILLQSFRFKFKNSEEMADRVLNRLFGKSQESKKIWKTDLKNFTANKQTFFNASDTISTQIQLL